MQDPLRKLALSDGRYSPEALRFLLESLDHALRLAGKEHAEGPSRHVTGREVLAGMRAYASEIFGPLAAQVWRSWGVRETMDWGRIVFLMVDAGLLKRQDTDTIDDFAQGFDFDEAFVARYVPTLPPTIEAGASGGSTSPDVGGPPSPSGPSGPGGVGS